MSLGARGPDRTTGADYASSEIPATDSTTDHYRRYASVATVESTFGVNVRPSVRHRSRAPTEGPAVIRP